MTIQRNIKRVIRNILVIPVVNRVVRGIAKASLVSSIVPQSMITRIPIAGDIMINLPNGKTLLINNDGNDTIGSRIYWIGLKSFEPETVGLLYKLLPRVRTFFDIGANSGFLSLLAAVDNPQRQIISFEPVPWIINSLERNIKVNRLTNVRAEAMALTNFDGKVDLYIPMDVNFPTGSSIIAGYREASQVISVPAMTVDTYVSTNKISKVDLLKIDTEMTEPQVLGGALNTIRRDQPLIICEVQPNKTERELEGVMADLGYSYYHIGERGLTHRESIVGDPTGDCLNYLFVPAGLTMELASILG